MIADYKVVDASSTRQLEVYVRQAITEGWIPQGGMSICISYCGVHMVCQVCQAMIREQKYSFVPTVNGFPEPSSTCR